MKCVKCGGSFKVLATRKRQQLIYRRLECVSCGCRETSREALIVPPQAPAMPKWTPKPRATLKPKPAPAPKPKAPRKIKAATAPVPELPRFGAHNPFSLAGLPTP